MKLLLIRYGQPKAEAISRKTTHTTSRHRTHASGVDSSRVKTNVSLESYVRCQLPTHLETTDSSPKISVERRRRIVSRSGKLRPLGTGSRDQPIDDWFPTVTPARRFVCVRKKEEKRERLTTINQVYISLRLMVSG
jgi:hypothetical protein